MNIEEKKISNWEVLKFFWQQIKTQKLFAGIALISSIIAWILWNFYPIITKNIIDLISKWDLQNNLDLIWANFYNLIFILIWLFLAWRIAEIFVNILELRLMKKIFSDSFIYITKHSYKFFSENLSWSLIKKINRLPVAFQWFIDVFIYDILWILIWFSVLFYMLFQKSMFLFWIFFWFLFLLVFVSYFLQNWQLKYHKIWLKEDSKIWWILWDVIANYLNVSIFWKKDWEKSELDNNLKKWYEEWISTRTKAWFVHSIQWVLIIIFEIIITFFALKMVLNWEMWIWTFVMIALFLMKLTPKFYSIWFIFKNIYRIFADVNEALQILKTPHEIVDIENAKDLEVKKWEIEFKNVDFKYKDWTEVFKNFNLKIKPWEKVALVWESWAWKTSIVQLLFRFFDIDWWQILIDWQDISKVQQDSLRKNISLVPQESVLFHRTLKENMIYWNENISEEKFLEISKKTHCHDFISELEKWYETLVWERWIKLSWWQRQRVSIARAIIESSKIFVLDEATSALDSVSEKKIQEALDLAMEWKTSIVIAHRLSTIMKMDRIVVLEKWEIIEEWTHLELLKKSWKYKKLWEIQSWSFEK